MLLGRISEGGGRRQGELGTTKGRKRKKELSVEELMRVEERRSNLRSRKGRGEEGNESSS